MPNDTVLIVPINVQRLDACYYAASPELPGLHVCGETLDAMMASTLLAVKELFRVNRGLDVRVFPASGDAGAFPRLAGTADRLVVQAVS